MYYRNHMLKLPPRLLQHREYASNSKVGTAEAVEHQMRTVRSSRGLDVVVPDLISFFYRSVMFDGDKISVQYSCVGAFQTGCTNF